MNAYGKGRMSVIKEITDFCNKQIESAQNAKSDDKHKNAHLSGVISAHSRIKDLLKNKEQNIENYLQ